MHAPAAIPDIIPQEHAELWNAARAWFATIVRELFATGFTAIGDGKRPELIGWLDRIEEVVRSLIIAAALALRPGSIKPETRDAATEAFPRNPAFAPTSPLPAFMTLPSPPASATETRAASDASTQPASASAREPKPPLTTDLGGQLIVRFFVLQRVMGNPERLIRRLALRCGARAEHDSLAIVSWAIDILQTPHSELMHALANACRNAALDAAALFHVRDPKPG